MEPILDEPLEPTAPKKMRTGKPGRKCEVCGKPSHTRDVVTWYRCADSNGKTVLVRAHRTCFNKRRKEIVS